MAFVTPTSNQPFTRVQWKWNSNRNPFSRYQPVEWRSYSDAENRIIEAAFLAGETHALLDDYHIAFNYSRQISNNNVNKQRPVTRMICNRDEQRFREDRFLPNPIAPDRPFGGLYGFISPFVKETAKDLGLKRDQLPSKNETVVPLIVEKAALGIVEEGKKIGKQRIAEWMANELRNKKTAGLKEVWKCCAYLYSIEDFLYKKLNEIMRLIGNEKYEQVWRSKIRTLGPFCLLLWDNPFSSKLNKSGTILYRGIELSDDLIASFKNDCSKDPKPVRSFQAFTSCTRNSTIAEKFGNSLLIMKVCLAFTVDLAPLSNYPHEEEELLFPGVCFTIEEVKFDNNKKKHLINLTLQQRHNEADHHELSRKSTAKLNKKDNIVADAFDLLLRYDVLDLPSTRVVGHGHRDLTATVRDRADDRFGFDDEWE